MEDIQTATAFNGSTAESFATHGDTVRGFIRYELVKRNLAEVVMGSPLDVVDVGGGAAIDASWLAGLGHTVTIIDPAEDQLRKAANLLGTLPPDHARRIKLVHGTAEVVLAQHPEHRFDLALSHGVAMYLDEPASFIRNLGWLVKPGSYISLLEKGFFGAKNGLIHEGEYEAAQKLEQTVRLINHQNREVWAFKPERLIELLRQEAHVDSIDWTGVRVTRDFDMRQTGSISPDELRSLVDQEYLAGKRTDLRAIAPMLHFVARTFSDS